MSNKTIAVAARTEPGDSIELRVFNPDESVTGADGAIDWTKTPYVAVMIFPDGMPSPGVFVTQR